MVVSEITGLFTIPYMLTLGGNAWDIINETGLVFFPFVIVLWREILKSRAMGRDEGSPAIMSVKSIEKTFITMLLVVLLGASPWGGSPGSVAVEYRQYSCLSNPSIIQGASSVTDLKPSSAYAGDYGFTHPSLLLGLTHDFGTGLAGTLTGKLDCKRGTQKSEISEQLTEVNLNDANLRAKIASFHEQCYTQALTRINGHVAQSSPLAISLGVPPHDGPEAFAYDSEAIKRSYSGDILVSPLESGIVMFVGAAGWPGYSTGSPVECQTAVTQVNSMIKTYLQGKTSKFAAFGVGTNVFDDMVQKIEEEQQLYNNTVQRGDIESDIIHAAYQNSVFDWESPIYSSNGKPSLTADIKATVQREKIKKAQTYNQQKTGQQNGYTTTQNHLKKVISGDLPNESNVKASINNTLQVVGQHWTNWGESVKVLTVLRIAPALISVLQGFIFMVAPMALVLSGWSTQILLRIVLLQLALAMIPFTLNLGVMFDSILVSLIENESNTLNLNNEIVRSGINLVGSTLIVAISSIWIALVQILGVQGINALVAGALGSGDDASAQVKKLATRLASDVVKGASKVSQNAKDKEAIKQEIEEGIERGIFENYLMKGEYKEQVADLDEWLKSRQR